MRQSVIILIELQESKVTTDNTVISHCLNKKPSHLHRLMSDEIREKGAEFLKQGLQASLFPVLSIALLHQPSNQEEPHYTI